MSGVVPGGGGGAPQGGGSKFSAGGPLAPAAANPKGASAPKSSKPSSSSNYTGNSGKNTVGFAKPGGPPGGKDYDKGRANAAAARGGGVSKDKPIFGFQSSGPERSKIPEGNRVPKKPKRVRLNTEEAQPTKGEPGTLGTKVNRRVAIVADQFQSLSHNRVGKKQRLCSFGSHRRSLNWIQPGQPRAQLIGPFSDALPFKQRRPLVS